MAKRYQGGYSVSDTESDDTAILEVPEEWQDTEPESAEQSEPDRQEENTADTEVPEDTAPDTDETESELFVDEAGLQTFAIDEITVLDESETALDETMPLFETGEESGTCGENANWTREGSVLT